MEIKKQMHSHTTSDFNKAKINVGSIKIADDGSETNKHLCDMLKIDRLVDKTYNDFVKRSKLFKQQDATTRKDYMFSNLKQYYDVYQICIQEICEKLKHFNLGFLSSTMLKIFFSFKVQMACFMQMAFEIIADLSGDARSQNTVQENLQIIKNLSEFQQREQRKKEEQSIFAIREQAAFLLAQQKKEVDKMSGSYAQDEVGLLLMQRIRLDNVHQSEIQPKLREMLKALNLVSSFTSKMTDDCSQDLSRLQQITADKQIFDKTKKQVMEHFDESQRNIVRLYLQHLRDEKLKKTKQGPVYDAISIQTDDLVVSLPQALCRGSLIYVKPGMALEFQNSNVMDHQISMQETPSVLVDSTSSQQQQKLDQIQFKLFKKSKKMKDLKEQFRNMEETCIQEQKSAKQYESMYNALVTNRAQMEAAQNTVRKILDRTEKANAQLEQTNTKQVIEIDFLKTKLDQLQDQLRKTQESQLLDADLDQNLHQDNFSRRQSVTSNINTQQQLLQKGSFESQSHKADVGSDEQDVTFQQKVKINQLKSEQGEESLKVTNPLLQDTEQKTLLPVQIAASQRERTTSIDNSHKANLKGKKTGGKDKIVVNANKNTAQKSIETHKKQELKAKQNLNNIQYLISEPIVEIVQDKQQQQTLIDEKEEQNKNTSSQGKNVPQPKMVLVTKQDILNRRFSNRNEFTQTYQPQSYPQHQHHTRIDAMDKHPDKLIRSSHRQLNTANMKTQTDGNYDEDNGLNFASQSHLAMLKRFVSQCKHMDPEQKAQLLDINTNLSNATSVHLENKLQSVSHLLSNAIFIQNNCDLMAYEERLQDEQVEQALKRKTIEYEKLLFQLQAHITALQTENELLHNMIKFGKVGGKNNINMLQTIQNLHSNGQQVSPSRSILNVTRLYSKNSSISHNNAYQYNSNNFPYEDYCDSVPSEGAMLLTMPKHLQHQREMINLIRDPAQFRMYKQNDQNQNNINKSMQHDKEDSQIKLQNPNCQNPKQHILHPQYTLKQEKEQSSTNIQQIDHNNLPQPLRLSPHTQQLPTASTTNMSKLIEATSPLLFKFKRPSNNTSLYQKISACPRLLRQTLSHLPSHQHIQSKKLKSLSIRMNTDQESSCDDSIDLLKDEEEQEGEDDLVFQQICRKVRNLFTSNDQHIAQKQKTPQMKSLLAYPFQSLHQLQLNNTDLVGAASISPPSNNSLQTIQKRPGLDKIKHICQVVVASHAKCGVDCTHLQKFYRNLGVNSHQQKDTRVQIEVSKIIFDRLPFNNRWF